MENKKIEIATMGGGCFWCVEAVLQEIKGVVKVISGYTGGNAPGRPTYREVCSGLTGHAEVVQVTFDSDIVAYKDILLIFMTSHDPTTRNRQGGDVGTQYRSVVYYQNDIQKEIAIALFNELKSFYDHPIVTELSPLGTFYEAEDYHQNYYRNNATQGYCNAVISPKLGKLRKMHADKLKGVST